MRTGRLRGIGAGLLGLASALVAEEGRFWDAYTPGPNTIALFHFDGNLKDAAVPPNEATLSGAAELAPAGRFGGALHLKGGALALAPGKPLSAFTLEVWLNPDKLPAPGQEAVILDRAYKPNEQRWAQLLLRSDGSLLWKHSRAGGRFGHGDAYAFSKPGALAAGQWQHLTVDITGGQETLAARLFVNGRNVTAPPYGNYLACEPDPTPGVIAFGARQPGPANPQQWWEAPSNLVERLKYREGVFVPFEGFMDELRLTTQRVQVIPMPDNAFTDPARQRPWVEDTRFHPGTNDLLFHVSFDVSTDADTARGAAGSGLKDVKLIPGVRGQGIAMGGEAGGYLRYAALSNFTAGAGTVAFWVRPHMTLKWPATMFTASPLYFSPFILVNNTYHFHEPLYPTLDLLPIEQWAHLAWVWDANVAAFYVNGVKAYEVPIRQPFPPTVEGQIGLGMPGPADFDELRVYGRPLTAQEVRNDYARYRPDPKPLPVGDAGLHVVDLRGVNRLAGSVFARRGACPGAARVMLALRGRGEAPLAETALPYVAANATPFVWDLPAGVQAGVFRLEARFLDAEGRTLTRGEQALARKDYPWLHNTAGKEPRVLHPWTPMTTGRGGIVGVVGRAFTLGRGGLFDTIDCWGAPLLAAPMRFEVKDKAGPASLDPRRARVTARSPLKVAWESETRAKLPGGGRLTIALSAAMDYDGAAKFTLTLDPGATPLPVEGVALVIPVPREYADLYSWNIGGFLAEPVGAERLTVDMPWNCELKTGDGEIFSSLREYENSWPGNMVQRGMRIPTVGNYMPQVWFGNNNRGISVFGDSDRGWVPDDKAPAIQVVARGAVAEIRLNFIATPHTLAAPRTLVFGCMATPVKPLPDDWRTGPYFGEFGTPWGSGTTFVADYEDERQDLPGMRAVVEQRRKQGLPSTPHINTVFFEPGPKTRAEFSAEWHDGYAYAPYATLPASKVDYMAWTLQRWKTDVGIDGMYFDCATPEPNLNVLSGTAYRLEDGRVQTGWTIWAHRDFFRRASTVFGDLYKGNLLWGNGFYGPEISGWQSATVVGEGSEVHTLGNKELLGRHQITGKDRWSYVPVKYYSDTIPGIFSLERIHAVSQQWGLIRLWQWPNLQFWAHPESAKDPPELVEQVKRFARSATAQLIVLDTRGGFGDFFPKYYLDFIKRPGLKHYGFWDNRRAFARQPEAVEVSAFMAGDEVLCLVANLGLEKTPVTLTIDLPALGFPAAAAAGAQVADAEAGAAWGATAQEVYWKTLWSGPTLLPEAERAVRLQAAAGKAVVHFTVNAKDFRAFRVTIARP